MEKITRKKGMSESQFLKEFNNLNLPPKLRSEISALLGRKLKYTSADYESFLVFFKRNQRSETK